MADGCTDPAAAVVDVFLAVMGEVFGPDSSCPPPGGGRVAVRFLAGDGALPVSLFVPGGGECDPLVWVRVSRRYRSRHAEFPAAVVGDRPCGSADVARVLEVEVGVARCTTMEADPDWSTLHAEAVAALDDTWRIETALCVAASRLRAAKPGRLVATDTIVPAGPSGGVIAWSGMAYVQL